MKQPVLYHYCQKHTWFCHISRLAKKHQDKPQFSFNSPSFENEEMPPSDISGTISAKLDALTSFFLIIILSAIFLTFATMNYFREKGVSRNKVPPSSSLASVSFSSVAADLGVFKHLIVNGITELNGEVFINGEKLNISELGQASENTIAGVASLQGETGDLTLTAGYGITIDGLTITNNNPNHWQNTFSKIAVDSTTFSANSTEDTLTFAAGGNISIVPDQVTKKLTISSTSPSGATGWQLVGSNVTLTDNSYNVGIGTTSPNNKLEALSTTSPQLRVAYDTSNYGTWGVSSTGVNTITTAGTAPVLALSTGAANANITLTPNGNGQTTITSPSGPTMLSLFAGTEANPKVRFDNNFVGGGGVYFGPGAATAVDTNLYRSAADILKTDDSFVSATKLAVGQSGIDTNTVVKIAGSTSTVGSGGSILGIFGGTVTATANNDNMEAFYATTTFAKAGMTGLNAYGIWADTLAQSGSGTIANAYGIYAAPQTIGTNNYGVRIDAASTQTLWISGNADNTTAAAGIAFGLSRDTNLYRSAANTLKTDDSLFIAGDLTISGTCTGCGGGGPNFWQINNGVLSPGNQTLDLTFGSTATAGAKLALSLSGTRPVASIGATTSYAGLVIDNTIGDLFTASSSGVTQLVLRNNGALGLGVALPTAKLDVLTSAGVIAKFTSTLAANDNFIRIDVNQTDASSAIFFTNSHASINSGAGIKLAGDKDLIFTTGNTASEGPYGANERMRITDTGIVGIGIANPTAMLHVLSTLGTSPAASISGRTAGPALLVTNDGVGDLIAASASGSINFRVKNNGDTVIGNGVGKITAGTFDPLYTIDGGKYSTFAPSMIGVKEEYAGKADLAYDAQAGGYVYTLNFNTFEQGSDLWVFSRVIDPDISTMGILLTPNSAARTWYRKDVIGRKITFYADRPTEISYRLTAPRFDFAKWGTVSDDTETLGLVPYAPPFPIETELLFAQDITQDPLFTLLDSNGNIIQQYKNQVLTAQQVQKLIQDQAEVLGISTGGISTISAQITTLSGRLDVFENNLNSQQDTIASISATLASLPIINLTKFATGGAVLGITTVDEDFAVSGNTTLNSLSTISNITVSNNLTLSSNSINTIGEDLQIQPLKQANVSFMDGLMSIDTQGNVKVTGNVRADSITLTKDKTIGSSTIPAGATSVTIETAVVEKDSMIVVTPTTSTNSKILYISDKEEGVGFTVSLDSSSSTTDIRFGWFIIGSKP